MLLTELTVELNSPFQLADQFITSITGSLLESELPIFLADMQLRIRLAKENKRELTRFLVTSCLLSFEWQNQNNPAEPPHPYLL